MKKAAKMRIAFLCFFAVFALFPLVYTLLNSFNTGDSYSLLPDSFGFSGYYEVFIRRPDYLWKFWTSLGLCLCIVLGQTLVSCLAAYGFSRFRFPFKNALFYVVIILMMMPYQVTLVSNYAMLDTMGLVNTYGALILPAVFSPFGVFLLRQVFDTCPKALCEAAELDGAGHLRMLFQIMIPRSRAGIASLIVLCFVDSWNMVEQPLVYLKHDYQYPLSVFLSSMGETNMAVTCACGVLAVLPVLLLFFYYDQDLAEGIARSQL